MPKLYFLVLYRLVITISSIVIVTPYCSNIVNTRLCGIAWTNLSSRLLPTPRDWKSVRFCLSWNHFLIRYCMHSESWNIVTMFNQSVWKSLCWKLFDNAGGILSPFCGKSFYCPDWTHNYVGDSFLLLFYPPFAYAIAWVWGWTTLFTYVIHACIFIKELWLWLPRPGLATPTKFLCYICISSTIKGCSESC